MTRPSLKPGVLLAPVDGGYLAYDSRLDQLHRLNPKAALIAELCDGRRTVDEIGELVGSLTPGGATDETRHWIEGEEAAALLAEGNGTSAAGRSAQELKRLAAKLRVQDQIEAAFVCQYRAAEIAPSDASAWAELGELAHICGNRDEARRSYQRYLELEPADAEARHLLTALSDGPAPARASDETIKHLYSRFSGFYDENMGEELEYRAPEQLYAALKPWLGERSELCVLDLGCGSGLGAVRLREHAREIVGVDLSPEMVELARKRDIYDRLETAEATAWLKADPDRYDLILACDTLIYFGDLEEVLSCAARILAPGGLVAFSVERGEHAPYQLEDSGRFAHHPDHIRSAAGQAELEVVAIDEAFLRMEYGREVTGLCCVLRSAAAS